jgi:hypothetical protein
MVEVAVTIYVFLLGLPILVYQIFLPEDLRRMSKKNYMGNLRGWLFALTAVLLLIIFTAYPVNIFNHLGIALPVALSKELVITVLFVMMLFLTLWFLFDHLIKSQGYRGKIIDVIKKNVLRNYKKTGEIDPAFLDDLEYLGIYSKGGTETRAVIEALEEMLDQLRKNKQMETGNGYLIALIEILCNAVANSVEPGSRQNMVEVLTLYKSILMDLRNLSTQENPLIYGNETRKIKDCTTKIALHALKRDFSDMMPLVLNVLTLIPRSSDKLFDIGLMALKKEQFQIAANVLSEIMDRDNQDYLTMHNYIGLIAHFYFAGKAARDCAAHSLQTNRVMISEEDLQKASEYHFVMSNFATVDKLDEYASHFFPGDAKAR